MDGVKYRSLQDSLALHRQRRAAGIPTVSVLIGAPEAAEALWSEDASREARSLVRVHRRADRNAAAALAEAVLNRPEVRARALSALAARLNVRLDPKNPSPFAVTGLQREWRLHRASLSAHDAFDRFCRILAFEQAPEDGAAWVAALAPGGEVGSALARIASLCIPDTEWPALLWTVTAANKAGVAELLEAARALGDLAAALPALPAALAVAPDVYDAVITRADETRYKALLRETPVRLPGASTEGAAGDAGGGVEVLRRVGAPESLVDRYRALAKASADRTLAEDGARSEAERFFFRLLESLPRTAGLFELNGRLPIPFGGRPEMEVDFLCRSRRIALELDGYHHFQDPARYRSDRTKDYLFQRHEYWILRFLVDDIVRDLEAILLRIFDALDSRADGMT